MTLTKRKRGRPKPVAKCKAGELLQAAIGDKSACDFAAAFGVSESLVGRWINGSRRPSLTVAQRLSRELGIPIEAW